MPLAVSAPPPRTSGLATAAFSFLAPLPRPARPILQFVSKTYFASHPLSGAGCESSSPARGRHTWLVALGVLLQLAHKVIEFLLALSPICEALLLQVWVVLLEELLLCWGDPVRERWPAHDDCASAAEIWSAGWLACRDPGATKVFAQTRLTPGSSLPTSPSLLVSSALWWVVVVCGTNDPIGEGERYQTTG